MPKIIVPIDFSITSADALRFGCYLSDQTGYELEAVHVYDGYDGENPQYVIKKGSARIQARVHEMLEKFVRVHAPRRSPAGMPPEEDEVRPIRTREVIGSAIQQLVLQSQRDDVALIVMGGVGTGQSSTVTPVFGSVARAVALRASCPVLLIPQLAGVPDIYRAAVAFDGVETLTEISERIAFLREALMPQMAFTHVMFRDPVQEEVMELDLMEAMFLDAFPGYEADFRFLPPGDVNDRILEYAEEEDVDLLIVGRYPRNFFTQMLAGSGVAGLISSSGVPVLVVPLAVAEA
ncbi:nucleotide-binding universal stress UspA family protein [Lewinella marina]|uniref:UspA domain-containing protein n=1 Tax=Neolewinella marina TaxID=438751 RepID=A0A2G0CAU3_9BACT|nr:universal stress protein [Neolewinella marina]NJB87199.1 nucleotide-binding universal stress UspA family protein [Neolewinella marina]PHK97080.1 hypothetical protein CGL56_17840 [Neolewinella marina]